MNKKTKDLILIALIYIIAFALGYAACVPFENTMLRLFVFDIAATVVTFVFSVACHNSSVYDAYWSLTPMVMSFWLFAIKQAFSLWHLLFLIAFNVWATRLTGNWMTVFTDFSYEDWRYRKYRDENGPVMWFIINFFGIHMVPTLVVFAGMLPLFAIAETRLGPLALIGMLVLLAGVALEFFADRQMHAFLAETAQQTVRTCCHNGLWAFSRHPNYVGEITVWLGVYLVMLPYAPEKWFFGIGALTVALLFNVVSIPLMEKRQRQRRADYADYCRETSRLLPLKALFSRH